MENKCDSKLIDTQMQLRQKKIKSENRNGSTTMAPDKQ